MSIEPLSALVEIDAADMGESLGEVGEFRMVALADLVIDRRYQRAVERRGLKNIRQIATGFRWDKFEPLLVAPAADGSGRFAILDGQHRAIAALCRGDIDAVPAMMHDLTLQEQARAFRDVNVNVVAMTPLQLHFAGLVAGDPVCVAIDTACGAAGVQVMRYNRAKADMRPYQTIAVRAIGNAVRWHGFDTARDTLATLATAGTQGAGTLLGAKEIRVVSGGLAIARRTDPCVSIDALQELVEATDTESLLDQFREQGRQDYMMAAQARIGDLLLARAAA